MDKNNHVSCYWWTSIAVSYMPRELKSFYSICILRSLWKTFEELRLFGRHDKVHSHYEMGSRKGIWCALALVVCTELWGKQHCAAERQAECLCVAVLLLYGLVTTSWCLCDWRYPTGWPSVVLELFKVFLTLTLSVGACSGFSYKRENNSSWFSSWLIKKSADVLLVTWEHEWMYIWMSNRTCISFKQK